MTTIDVVFRGTWLTDITDPTVSLQVWKTARAEEDALDVQVRNYAGRTRIITTPKRDRSTPLTLRGVTDADLETLRGWRGRLLLLRDAQGWRRWGTFASIGPSTVQLAPQDPLHEVSLTFVDVDYDEEVPAVIPTAPAAGPAPLTLEYFGSHILGPIETNIGGLGISTLWPAWSPTTVRLLNNYGWNTVTEVYSYMNWSSLNTADGVYDWDVFDRILTKLQAEGVTELIYTLHSTPGWAGGGASNDLAPTSMASITTFINAVAARAVSLGMPIQYWEVWNEPNTGAGVWSGTTAEMVTIAQTVYNAVHAYDASYRVISPACQGYSTAWTEDFLGLGGGAYCDIMAFHGYLGTAPSTEPESIASLIGMYQGVYATYGQAAKPVWDTEAMDITDPGIAEQARFLAVYYALHAGLGVDRFFWYAWDGDWGQEWDATTGINTIGVANATIIGWLVGAGVSAPATTGTVWTVPVDTAGVPSLIVWDSAGASAYATAFGHQTNLAGTTTVVTGGSVTIGTSPILLTV